MASIIIYDSTETDRTQLGELLGASEHDCEYIEDEISVDNIKPDAEIISVFVTSTVSRELIDKMPKLRLIALRSTGFNNVDMAAAKERGVAVVNVPSYGEHTVAEFAFTLILALSRKLLSAIQAVENADVDQPALRGFDLNGKTIGIVGAGRIGRRAAEIAKGFGMEVLAFDPFPNEEAASKIGYKHVELPELFANSDVISIHAPYTPENHHLVNKELLTNCKPSAILVNTARGELLDSSALIEALKEAKLAGAGLDVLEGEGLLDIDEELLLLRQSQASRDALRFSVELRILEKMPNVILTPHNAFNTEEAVRRINETSAQNILDFAKGTVTNQVEAPATGSGKLVITRHGESEWNAKGVWTGSTDVHLTEKGFHEASLLGQILDQNPKLDYAYTSQQIRSLETLEGILNSSQQFDVPFERVAAFNERDYGDYTGLNKWEVQKQIGEEAFNSLRRNWDYPVPNGETLKMVYERAVPHYLNEIVPKLRSGKNVLIVAHGNSLRALIKYLESISDEDVASLEMPFGNLLIYDVDEEGRSTSKEERKIDTTPPPA